MQFQELHVKKRTKNLTLGKDDITRSTISLLAPMASKKSA